MVSALMVSHVNWDGRMKGWKEVVGTCECKDERNGHIQATKYAETNHRVPIATLHSNEDNSSFLQ